MSKTGQRRGFIGAVAAAAAGVATGVAGKVLGGAEAAGIPSHRYVPTAGCNSSV